MTRWKNLLLLVAAVVIINLPAVLSLVQRERLDADGVQVRSQVVQRRVVDDQAYLSFSVPKDSPRPGNAAFRATVRVDRTTYDEAGDSGVVDVRVLPGSTSTWRVDGQVGSRAGFYFVVLADAVLLAIVLAYLRFRTRLRPTLVLQAEDDLEAVETEPLLDRFEGQRYIVCGVISEVEPDAVTVDVADRRVRVLLDGHHNPVEPGGPVRAVGTMIG